MTTAAKAYDSQLDVTLVTKTGMFALSSQLGVVVVAKEVAPFAYDSGLDITSILKTGPTAYVSQLETVVLTAGQVSSPQVRVWTYSLDDHDFYVVGLGDSGETLVCDLTTNQWAVWGDAQTTHWRAVHGLNWIGSGMYGGGYGSDVICGDDTNGSIYFLDPTYPYDDDRNTGEADRVAFECQAAGQLVLRGNDEVDCGVVGLTGSVGEAFDGTLTAITLEFSDDAGNTYLSAGTVNVSPGQYVTRVEWTGLGSIKTPGRIFRITDNGAVSRIDGLEVVDPEDNGG